MDHGISHRTVWTGFLLIAAILLTQCTAPLNTQLNPTSKAVDLAPGVLSFAVDRVPDGGTLPISLTLHNLQPGTPGQPYSIDFYLALSSTFLPGGTDAKIGSTIVSAGPAGDSTLVVAANLSIPPGHLNQAVYIYAVVDALGVITETNTTNQTSTALNAGVVLVYDLGDPSRKYKILLDTYAPATGSHADTIMALYDGTGAYLKDALGPAGYVAIDTGPVGLGSGTYYVEVTSYNDGPYAMAVRTSGIDHISFSALTSNAQDPYEPDNTFLWPVGPGCNLSPLPAKSLAMPVGTMVNRYASNTTGDFDWFTFTLP